MAKPRKQIEIGKEYGRLTVLSEAPKSHDGHIQWNVRCRCGKEYAVLTCFLSKPDCKCIECSKKESNKRSSNYHPGAIVNGWEIITESDPNKYGAKQYVCRCIKCGAIAVKTIGSMKNRKGNECVNCPPCYSFRVDGSTAVGILPDGTEFFIDSEMVDAVSKYHWYKNSKGYIVRTEQSRHKTYLHWFVLNHAYSSTILVDHINRMKTDCRSVNLRLVTAHQNAMNKSLIKSNTSGYVGVNYNPKIQRYNARIFLNERAIYLGSSKDPIECAQMYNIASEMLFREYGGHKNDVAPPSIQMRRRIEEKCSPFLTQALIATMAVS